MSDRMEQQPAEHEHLPASALAEALAQIERDIAAGDARGVERRARRFESLGDLKSARATASDLSWELEDLEQRLRELLAQREGPGDQLIDRELASMAGRRAALEEQVLTQMILVDDLATRVAGDERALADKDRAWASQRRRLQAEHDRISRLLAGGAAPGQALPDE